MKAEKTNRVVFDLLQQQLAANQSAVFLVISNSMTPLIRVGDRVVITSANTAVLTAGDIILYLNGNSFCMHRLVRIIADARTQKFITRGDRLQAFDAPVNEEKYLGKIIFILRENGIIDLNQNKFTIFNKAIGKLFMLQWLLMRAGERFRKMFLLNSNTLTRLGNKVSQLLFFWTVASIEYLLIRIKFFETNENS